MRLMLPFLLLLAGCGDNLTLDSGNKDSGSDSGGGGGDRYHPDGWSASDQHGPAAKMRTDDCQGCHGDDLSGGTGVSCDSCHESGWRTNCTFCHGGDDNSTGAPPQDIDDSSTDLSFNAHTSHVDSDMHPDYDCTQCHVKPEDVLSDGHLFNADDTKGVAEVDFSGGLSDAGNYGGGGSCSNLYCHGDGDRGLGSANDGAKMSCTSCHGGVDNDWSGLGGEHNEHRREGVDCQECHGDTTSNGTSIKTADVHVNGKVDTAFESGMEYSGGECTGSCHGENHKGRDWN